MQYDKKLLDRAYRSWDNLSDFYRRRRECKRAAYGTNNTNNLIRSLIKQVVGRYRYIVQGEKVEIDSSLELERDSRALEEFLISGSVFQRVEVNSHPWDYYNKLHITNVSPSHIFFEPFLDSNGADAEFIGMLHDMTRVELLQRFSGGHKGRGDKILENYGNYNPRGILTDLPSNDFVVQFERPDIEGRYRVIEVWHKVERSYIEYHDDDDTTCMTYDYKKETYDKLMLTREERRRAGGPRLDVYLKVRDEWERVWLSPSGMVLLRDREYTAPPFVLKLYPMIDAEVHSLVEDVLSQQWMVNRMVSLLDDVVSHSAKGVLLFPVDQKPDGFTWKDMRRIWADPGGIVPYKRTSKSVSPQQVNSTGWNTGASDMLQLQMKLFNEVAGVSAMGDSRAKSAEAMQFETENCTIGMLDVLASFESFIKQRDLMMKGVEVDEPL